MKIDFIQDYANRLSLTDSQVQKLKNLEAEVSNSSSDFQRELRERINEKITGSVSSSEVSLPNNIKKEISVDPYRKKLFDASVEFESMFVKLMLNQMRKSVEKGELLHGGYAEEIFEDMLYDEYARDISKNSSLGLAEQIYQSLSQNLPPIIDKKI
jgi:peptidoglycan hydrolase FlgJ